MTGTTPEAVAALPRDVDTRPAVIGGPAACASRVSLVRPWLPDSAAIASRIESILASGTLTNGATVRELEAAARDRLGVTEVVAVSSCTAGLMLVLQALQVHGPVVVPSFTFSASAHAIVWAGGSPRWAEIDPDRMTVDPEDVEQLLDGATAVMATHVYGAPARVDALERLAAKAGIPLVFDAAHALGSSHAGVPVGGFGSAEVFSLSPTKVAVAGEGGLIATNDPELAARLRIARDYGNPGDYDCLFPGLNARMSELHAAVGLASLARLDEAVRLRNELVEQFRTEVSDIPGLGFQVVEPDDISTYKDLTVTIDPSGFGLSAEQLTVALEAEGIDTRRYYAPPVHRQQAYAGHTGPRELPATDALAARVLTLPLWTHMSHDDLASIGHALRRIQRSAEAVAAALSQQGMGSR